jgi:hypothetical protein
MLGEMAPPAPGSVVRRPRADGLTSFCLRFRAYGARRFVTLGTEEEGWTPARAHAELRKVLALVEAGVWRPEDVATARLTLDPGVRFETYAAEWVRRWRGGEFGDPPDSATVADYVEWRLRKHLLPFFGRTPPIEIDQRLCARFKAHKIAEREELAAAVEAGADLRDERGMRVRPLSNRSITMFCRLLGQILEQAVTDGLIESNQGRGKHMKLASPRPARTFLELDELADLLDAGSAMDRGESDKTQQVRALADSGKKPADIAAAFGDRCSDGLLPPRQGSAMRRAAPSGGRLDTGLRGPAVRGAVRSAAAVAASACGSLRRRGRQDADRGARGRPHARAPR